ncbi:MAG: AccI family restriction endonuclease [Pseudomonadota bacterium]
MTAQPSLPPPDGAWRPAPDAAGFAPYETALHQAAGDLYKRLRRDGIVDPADTIFSAPTVPRRRPSPRHSRFKEAWPLGDWAETALLASIAAEPKLTAERLDADNTGLQAGSPAFADAFLHRCVESASAGKRPDLLVHHAGGEPLGAIEVRASRYHVGQHLAYRAKIKAKTSIDARIAMDEAARPEAPGLGFTIKLEDLRGIYHWITHCRLPQMQVQVFLDRAYAINSLRAFELLAYCPERAVSRRSARSQNKPTFYIPLDEGVEIGVFSPEPALSAEPFLHDDGKAGATFLPSGGTLVVNASALREELQPHRPSVPDL